MFDLDAMTLPELNRLIKNLEAELQYRKETTKHHRDADQAKPGKGKGRNK